MVDKDLCCLADKEVLTLEQSNNDKYKEWIRELKLDGSRCMFVNGVLINRRGIDVTKQYPHITIENKDTILDGEVCYITDEHKGGSFNDGRKKENWEKCIYVVFDVIKFEGELIKNKPLSERKKYLEKVRGNIKIITEFAFPTAENIDEYEGVMIKNPNSEYVFGRTSEWIKVKPTKKIIIDFTGYEQNTDGSITAYNELGDRVKVGRDIEKAKQQLDSEDKCSIEVNYLEQNPITKRYRQITFSEVK